ncbi:uncharacterized protein SPPG_07364 [Spizellomyces punctatus DAOM BR117]|uniref:Uncharacterized protein n=1 Tax=Spizellomyces punctatus (strain DAOM BR117) TaxID=645134 RepID=A0A0L0H9V8_SPIPD|nr:uncharacterized protein SPPG_07364 [Spizellomyces punctatus DAOM BR117]KNC97443.1 hypothetical protein SPPG_07364 [Spizellomyces punctatus DAOM BR117]|eukprot:XP_016605483.1 hypothetical protein SPPG_07364 [Spizellomyces punctatus DAOM BR117]
MSISVAKPLGPSNFASPAMTSNVKPRRKPVNYEKLTISTARSEDNPVSAPEATSLTESALVHPSPMVGLGSPDFEKKNASQASVRSLQSLASRSEMHSARSTNHSPLPPPPRIASANMTRTTPSPKIIVDSERPISASLGHLFDAARRPPSPMGARIPKKDAKDLSKSAPNLTQSPMSSTDDSLSAKLALETDPQKRELLELKHLCESLQKEKEQLLTKYRRRAHFGVAKFTDDPNFAEEFRKLTEEAEARKREHLDLHAAIELLMRRIMALEKQVVGLGAQPVTKTDVSLSEAKLNDITHGVWQHQDTIKAKVEASTAKTASVMADIQAKTREIRRHLKLPVSEDVAQSEIVQGQEQSESIAASAAEPAEPRPASGMTSESTTVPANEQESESAAVETAGAQPTSEVDFTKTTIGPLAKEPQSAVPSVAEQLNLQPESEVDSNSTANSPPKKEGEDSKSATPKDFADDLLAIMNDFGF